MLLPEDCSCNSSNVPSPSFANYVNFANGLYKLKRTILVHPDGHVETKEE